MLYWTFPRYECLEIIALGQLQTVQQGRPSHEADCSPREPNDDFFCLRFGVWYASVDCAYRTRYRTCPGCFHCDQGRFNLKRHRSVFLHMRRISGGG